MYIAHRRKSDSEIQTVKSHALAVEKLCAEYASGLNFPHIMQIAALLHDAGKMNGDFVDYINEKSNLRRGEIDHSFAGAKYLIELSRGFEDESILETALFIARIIVSHHGLHDWIDGDFRDYLAVRISKSERYDEIREGIKTLVDDDVLKAMMISASNEFSAIKEKLYELCGRKSIRFSFYMGMFERLAESVLVDADRTDTADFMDGIKPRKFDTDAIWEKVRDKIERKCDEYRRQTDRISLLRMDISDRCARFAEAERGICRLTVPTGGGKTLSSFRFAVNYCKRFGKKKIIYVAPFMSILEQNSDVLRDITGDEILLEHHSNIASGIENREELNDYELKCERWEDPVISTTAVQFLNTLFSGKMASVRRLHTLTDSVIIIDEIQALPIKCVYLFNLAMNFLSRVCGCVIVLCSATQPSLEWVDHPLLFDAEESMTGDFSEDFRNFKRTEIVPEMRKEQYTFEQAADYAYEKFLENGNLLVIMNTKKAALEMFALLKEKCIEDQADTEVIHLSTFMCPAHRKEKLGRARKLLDKRSSKPVICVTTQLIEAGVDISFKCVIRSAAGAESVAQAAGRCNRHGDDEVRSVYVINIKDENLGKLEQIRKGRDLFVELAGICESNLLSNEAIALYFRKLYSEYKDKLGYPVDYNDIKLTLLDLLSDNKANSQMCKSKLPHRAQAFASAGMLFRVIEENTRDIIVPYNDEAKDIIRALDSDIPAKDAVLLLRKAQAYSVSVYPSAFGEMLEKHKIRMLKFGNVFALDELCFDDNLGISDRSVSAELLMY